jgi:hypothetical protein
MPREDALEIVLQRKDKSLPANKFRREMEDTRSTYHIKPRKYQINYVVNCFNEKNGLPGHRMPRPHHSPDMSDGVGRGKEGSIEPSAALSDKLGKAVGHIRFSFGTFHIA